MSTKTTLSFAPFLALCAVCTGLTTTGCMQEPLCEELGSCGGTDPLGTWQLAPGYPSCTEDLYTPATDIRLTGLGLEVPPGRTPPVEPALFDWCYLLVTGGAEKVQRKPPRFYYESGPIGWASITYSLDPMTNEKRYTVGVTRTGTFLFDFPAVCIRSFGATDGRPPRDSNGMVVGEPTNVCKQLQVSVAEAGIGEGSYPNVICEPNPQEPEGCVCQFDVGETGGSAGTYEIIGNTIRHEPSGTSAFPQVVTYCNKGGALELTGHDGNYLFGQKGLRTMNLLKTQ